MSPWTLILPTRLLHAREVSVPPQWRNDCRIRRNVNRPVREKWPSSSADVDRIFGPSQARHTGPTDDYSCRSIVLPRFLPPEPPPVKPVVNPFAIERPHAAPHLLERQGSFRGFSQLNQSSPFKRQMSLRIGDLPSTVERQQNSLSTEAPSFKSNLNGQPGNAIFQLVCLVLFVSFRWFYVWFLSICNWMFVPCRKSTASSSSESPSFAVNS